MSGFLPALLTGLTLGSVPSVQSNPENTAQTYIAVMCDLTGNWTGRFDLHNESGIYRTFSMNVAFQCFPNDELVMETRTFVTKDDATSYTLAVIFPAGEADEMQMSYFGSGKEGVYFFKAVRLEYDDAEHWIVAREASQKTHQSDRNPPVARYTHIRNGSELTMIREVKPDHASPDWTLSSKLILEQQP